jgi:hypothetical protein
MIDCGQSRFVTFLQKIGCPTISKRVQKTGLPLLFIDRRIKIYAKYYKEKVFEKNLFRVETCMETTIFASSKTEPHPTLQKSSRSGVATQLTGFESTGFLHLGLPCWYS